MAPRMHTARSVTVMRSCRSSNAVALLAFLAVHAAASAPAAQAEPEIPLQPLAQQVRAVESTLSYLGEPLSREEHDRINRATAGSDEPAAVAELQAVLDGHVLLEVDVNPESRVKVTQGRAKPELVEGGTRLFLVKVRNAAGVTAPLAVDSPNGMPPSHPSWASEV